MKKEESTPDRIMIECNMDDIDPERLSFLREKLEEAGARDVTVLSGTGKKGRIIHLLQVLILQPDFEAVSKALFLHSSTIGFRYYTVKTRCLKRSMVTVEVEGHTVDIKCSSFNGEIVQKKAEFEDCKKVSVATGLPIEDVRAMAYAKLKTEN